MGRELKHFINIAASEVLCCSFLMAGIESEPTFPVGFYPHTIGTIVEPGLPYQTTIAEGRLYDIYAFLRNETRRPLEKKFTKDINPLPVHMKSMMEEFLRRVQKDVVTCPYNLPDRATLDPDDMKTLIRFGTRHRITYHYLLYNDKDSVIRLYGENIVEEATGETVNEFRKRIDGIIASKSSKEEAGKEISKQTNTYWCQRVIPSLKKQTLDRYNPVNQPQSILSSEVFNSLQSMSIVNTSPGKGYIVLTDMYAP